MTGRLRIGFVFGVSPTLPLYALFFAFLAWRGERDQSPTGVGEWLLKPESLPNDLRELLRLNTGGTFVFFHCSNNVLNFFVGQKVI